MKNLFLFIYRAVVAPIGVLAAMTLGALFVPKVREGLRLRSQKRDWPQLTHPPIWIHASSGEFEYAKPVIRELKSRHPQWPIVVTYFSPSYAKSISAFPGVDFSLPLPIDLPGPTQQFLQRLRPKIGLIARTDLWPELLHQAKKAGVPMILFSLTRTRVPPLPVRWVQRWLYGYLNMAFCVNPADTDNIKRIAPRLSVQPMGDTRFDQVQFRLQNPKLVRNELRPEWAQTLVAGSTWSEDESVLLTALADQIRDKKLCLVLAPHEPTPNHIVHLTSELKKRNLEFCVYSSGRRFDSGVLIIDSVGILAELYRWGKMAFVGGSFKGSVHSVMEPLAAGCVTIVGPYHANNREALDFMKLQSAGQSFVQAVKDGGALSKVIESTAIAKDISKEIAAEISRRGGVSRKLVDYIDGRQSSRQSPSAEM